MKHSVGIIGLGTVGSRFVEQFNLHGSFDLKAAWDPDPAACKANEKEVRIAESASAVIEEADVVYIAVPPLFHDEYVRKCVAADSAIFCEKPLGIDITQSRELVTLVNKAGTPAGVNFVFSAAPSATKMSEIVGQPEFGEIIRCDLDLHFRDWPRAWHINAQWLRDRDQGGWVREVVSHFLFIINRSLGTTSLNNFLITYPDGPVGKLAETDLLASLVAGGKPISIKGTSGGAGPDIVDLTIRGTNSAVRIWDWYQLQVSENGEWRDLLGTDRPELGTNAYIHQLDQLALMIEGETNLIASFDEALAVQEIVEEILSSQ